MASRTRPSAAVASSFEPPVERLERRLHVVELLPLHLAQPGDHLGEGVEEVLQLVARRSRASTCRWPSPTCLSRRFILKTGPATLWVK